MIEELKRGFEAGYNWIVDHDNTAGTIGVTVTDNGSPQPGQLMLNGRAFQLPSNTLVGTFLNLRIDQFDNRGRQVLWTNSGLVGIVEDVPRGQTPPYNLDIWTTFQPA